MKATVLGFCLSMALAPWTFCIPSASNIAERGHFASRR